MQDRWRVMYLKGVLASWFYFEVSSLAYDFLTINIISFRTLLDSHYDVLFPSSTCGVSFLLVLGPL